MTWILILVPLKPVFQHFAVFAYFLNTVAVCCTLGQSTLVLVTGMLCSFWISVSSKCMNITCALPKLTSVCQSSETYRTNCRNLGTLHLDHWSRFLWTFSSCGWLEIPSRYSRLWWLEWCLYGQSRHCLQSNRVCLLFALFCIRCLLLDISAYYWGQCVKDWNDSLSRY